MEREIIIGGKTVKMKCSALLPRIYRHKFGHDMIVDMAALRDHYNKAILAANSEVLTEEEKQQKQLSVVDLEIFENIAWLFCRSGDPENVPDNPEDWLEGMDGMFSVYEVLPEIIKLWNDAQRITSTPKNA